MFRKAVLLIAIVGLLQTQVGVALPTEHRSNELVYAAEESKDLTCSEAMNNLKEKGLELIRVTTVIPPAIVINVFKAAVCIVRTRDIPGCIKQSQEALCCSSESVIGQYSRTVGETKDRLLNVIKICIRGGGFLQVIQPFLLANKTY